ncbi:hypothetical protein OE810_01495 [Rhodobacteraceae bacterium XHP0102]|nr:hypothetical protein [Rhodobacteraceae bacterium XHP0102]
MKTRWMETVIALSQADAPRLPWMRDVADELKHQTLNADLGQKRAS